MDGITADDASVLRGMQILEDKAGKALQPTTASVKRAAAEGAVAAEPGSSSSSVSPSKKRASKKSTEEAGKGKKGGGLDVGRRLLVVVKNEQDEPTSPSKVEQDQHTIKVFDHGSHQKEAVRRLFNAQVMLGSYEGQLYEKEVEVRNLQKELREAQNNPYDLEGREEKTSDIEMSFQKGGVNLKRQIPYWLSNDKVSRQIVESMRESLMKSYEDSSNTLDKTNVIQHFWQCSLDIAMRWAGNPDEAIAKQNQNLTEKARDVQREAMKESSVLRSHVKKYETKHKALQDHAKALAGKVSDLQRHLKTAQAFAFGGTAEVAAAAEMGPVPHGEEYSYSNAPGDTGLTNRRPSWAGKQVARSIVDTWRSGGASEQPGQNVPDPRWHGGGSPGNAAPGQRHGFPGSPDFQGQQAGFPGQPGAPGPQSGAEGANGGSQVELRVVHHRGAMVPQFPAYGAPEAGAQNGSPGPAGWPYGAPPQDGVPPQYGQGMMVGPGGGPQGGAQGFAGGGPYGAPQGFGGPGGGPQGGAQGFAGPGGGPYGGPQGFGGPGGGPYGGAQGFAGPGGGPQGGAQGFAGGGPNGAPQGFGGPGGGPQGGAQGFAGPGGGPYGGPQGFAGPGGGPQGGAQGFGGPGGGPQGGPQGFGGPGGGAQGGARNQGSPGFFGGVRPRASKDSVDRGLSFDPGYQSRDLFAPVQAGNFDIGEMGSEPQLKGNKALAEDPYLMVNASLEELETMDNEIYEVCDGFDEDMKELFIDAVDEKVRRILMLDPEKFKGGKLPFGIRPKADNSELEKLEDANRVMKRKQLDMEKELDEMRAALADAHRPRTPRQESKTVYQTIVKEGGGHHAAPVRGRREAVAFPTQDRPEKKAATTTGEGMSEHAVRERKAGTSNDAEIQRLNDLIRKLKDELRSLKAENAELKDKVAQNELESDAKVKEATKVVNAALVKAAAMLRKQLKMMGPFLGQTQPNKAEKTVDSLIGHGGDSKAHLASMPHFEDWCDEITKNFKQNTGGKTLAQLMAGGGTITVQDPELLAELERLRQKVAEQEKEISRLLLIIDELRARLDKLPKAARGDGPMSEKAALKLMGHIGLREMIEAKGVPELKGVFQRLYEDAVQRIQRFALIKDQVAVATKAYSDLVQSPRPLEETAPATTLEELSATASATLKGMWYPGERSWKKACEWAIAEAVEANVSRLATSTVNELMENNPPGAGNEMSEGPDGNKDAREISTPELLGTGGGSLPRRTPGRRGTREPRGFPGAWSTSPMPPENDAHSFWHPYPGGLVPESLSPRKIRKAAVMDPEPSSFTNYVAQLRAARGDLGTAEWPRLSPATGGKKISITTDKGTLKGAVGADGGSTMIESMLGGSRSLPALPRIGRNGLL